MHCAVTGSTGFIGRALAPLLEAHGHRVSPIGRAEGFDLARVDGSIDPTWIETLRGVDVVVHLAANVHQLQGDPVAEAARHLRINRDGTIALARAALAAGVRRFVFVSTAKVFGEGDDGPYRLQSPAKPHDAYAQSKWQAEQSLRALTAHGAMELVIVRPPLVYGAEAGANFLRLQRLAQLPIPLPIATIRNRRDMIGIDNLIDLLLRCVEIARAPQDIVLCSDGQPYALADVVATIRRASGKRPLLFRFPPHLLQYAAATLLGREAVRRLFGDFELDISATREQLDWSPPFTMLAILQRTPGQKQQ